MVNPQGTSQVEVSGTFRLHGQDHDFTMLLPVEMHGPEATASTHFSIPYQKWGLKNPTTLILRVKDIVDIDTRSSPSGYTRFRDARVTGY